MVGGSGGDGGSGGQLWRKGLRVEVSSSEEGFTGVWFEATIVKPPWKSPFTQKTNKALVKYETLVTDDEEGESKKKKPLEEYVHERFIRPIPCYSSSEASSASSEVSRECFELNDVVDAFHLDGWWTGVITQVLPSSIYTVTFHNPPDKLDLHFSSLRLHLDWIDGKWVRPEKEVITAAEYPEQLGHSCNTTKNTTEAIQLESLGSGTENTKTEDRMMVSPTDSGKNQIEQATPCNQIFSCAGISTKKKSKQATPSSDATISRPLKRTKKGDTAEYKGGQKIEISQYKERGTTSKKKKRGRPRKLLAEIQKSSGKDAVGKDCSSDEVELSKTTNVNPTDAVGKDCSSYEVELPTTTNVNPTGFQDASIGKLAEVSQTDCRRKKAKMAITEISIDMTQPLRMCSEGISSSTKFDDSYAVGKDCSSDEIELPTTTNVNPTGSQDASIGKVAEVSQTDCRREKAKMPITEISFDMTQPLHMCSEGISSSTKLDDLNAVGKDCSSDEVELPTTTNVNPTGSQDASIGNIAEVSQTDCRREKAKMAITEISFDMTQPLHMCSEGISSSRKLDDSSGTVNQLNEANESIVELPLIECTDNNVLCLNQKLPFVKSSPVWEMIESMEIFQTMQQYPHFHPLYNFKEECREGLAIGTMVTFANLVEKTCKLQLDDPRSIWVSHLEILLDLEKHGLDVQVLRDRLNEQLVIKDRQEQNLDELKKHEIQLLVDVNKNNKTDEEIDKLNENIREFEEKLASAMSIKKIQDSETAALQLRADDIREGIRSTQLDFERVSAAPLLTGL